MKLVLPFALMILAAACGSKHDDQSELTATKAKTPRYIGTVKDGANSEACISTVKKIKGVTLIGKTNGFFLFAATAPVSRSVADLACVKAVQPEKFAHPLPSTKVGN